MHMLQIKIENDCNFHTRIKNMYFNVKSAYYVVRQHITRLKELPSIKRFIWFNCNRFKGISIKKKYDWKSIAFHIRKRDSMYLTNIYTNIFFILVYVLLFIIDLVFLKLYSIYLHASFLICLFVPMYLQLRL